MQFLSVLNLKVKLTDLVCTYLNSDLNFTVFFYIRESRGGIVFPGSFGGS